MLFNEWTKPLPHFSMTKLMSIFSGLTKARYLDLSAPLSVQVDELSQGAQQVIHSYTDRQQGQAGKYAALCAANGILPWQPPTAQDHEALLKVRQSDCCQELLCKLSPVSGCRMHDVHQHDG